MSDEKIVVELTLEDGKYTGRMKNAGALARAFTGDINRADKATKKMARSMSGGVVPAVRDFSIIVGQARNVVHQLWFVMGGWTQTLIKTSAEVERLTFLMRGMSDATDATSKMKDAANNVDALFEAAKNAPFSMNTLSDSFVKFKSVGLDPLDGSMQALTDAVAAFGGTDETFHRASIAIQQMAGKGVISMEELRQQLGEAVPQAITIMARSMGVSYGELVDQISKGTVAAKPALEAMFNGMSIVYGGRAQAMMDTYNGRIAKLKTSWTQLIAKSSGIQSFFEGQKDLITELTNALDSDAIKQFADDLGGFLTSVMNKLTGMVSEFTVAYGKAKSFYNLMTSTADDPSTFIGTLKISLEAGIKLIQDLDSKFRTLRDSILAFSMGMSVEEYHDSIFEQRIRDRSDFAAEEYDKLVGHVDNVAERIAAKEQKIADVSGRITEAMASFSHKKFGIVTSEQLDRDVDKYRQYGIELKKARMEQDRLEEAYRQAQQNFHSAKDVNDLGPARQAMDAARVARDEAKSLTDSIRSQLGSLEGAIQSVAEKSGVSFLDIVNKAVPAFEILSSGADLSEEQLAALGVEGAEAARTVAELEKELESLKDLDIALDEVIDTEFATKIEEGFQDASKVFEEFEDTVATESAKMLEEIDKINTDKSKSETERANQAAQVVNDFYNQQITSLMEISNASMNAMLEEGELGVQIALRLADVVGGILSSLNAKRDGLLGSLGDGVVTTSPSKPKSTGGGGGKSKGARAMEKLKDLIKDANKESDKLAKRFADPFGYELPAAIDKARDKINKLAEDISGGKWTQEMKNLFDTMATNAMTEEMIEMAQATKDIERSLMGERDARKEIYDEEVRRIKQMKEKLIEMGIWRVEWEQTIQDQLIALQKEHEAQSPMGEFLNEWKNIYDDIEQVGVDTMKSLSQGMADMVTEGKADFDDLARSAVNSLLQISFNAALSGLGSVIQQGIGGWFGGAAPVSGPVGVSGSIWHTGGMVGETGRSRTVDPSMFSNAQRYHTGGVIGQEVPAILEKGEGVFTAEQMKAIGKGMSGPGETKVNIINNTGTEVDSEEATTRMSPDGLIMDIVLKKVQQPGPFRDGMKRALK